MAISSNKSSSSSTGSRVNPNARNSEVLNSMRRSFVGNPFGKPSIVANPRGFNPNTPINSPSEHTGKNSMGRESIVTLRENEDKENGKAARVRSPMGSKNFMSPTISAAFKFTPSPRKKILEEGNEAVRTSTSFSDFKIASFTQPTGDTVHKKENLAMPLISKAASESETVSKRSLRVTFCEEPEVINVVEEPPIVVVEEPQIVDVEEEPDLVNLDPYFKISPPPCSHSSIPSIAPLDSDPLMPPYDPQINYLSPRPKFLCYKPNPVKRLEDSFIYGSSSDTDVTEETQSDDSQKELEDVSSSEVIQEDEKEEEEELTVSEPTSVDLFQLEETVEAEVSELTPVDLLQLEEIVEAKGASSKSKPSFSWRSKFTTFLILMLIAGVSFSVINSPGIDYSASDGSTFLLNYDLSEIAEFAKAKCYEIVQNIRVWSAKYVSYLSELISNLRGVKELVVQHIRVWSAKSVSYLSELFSNLRGVKELESFHYCNLTSLFEDEQVDGYAVFDHFDGEKHEINVVEPEALEEEVQLDVEFADSIEEMPETHIDAEYEAEIIHQEADASINLEDNSEEYINLDYEDQAPIVDVVEPEISVEEQSRKVEDDVSGHIDSKSESTINFEEKPVLISQAEEIPFAEVSEDTSSGAVEVQAKISEAVELQSSVDEIASPVKEDFVWESTELDAWLRNTQSLEKVGIVLLLLLALIAGTVFISAKKGNTAATSNTVAQPLPAKKLDASPTAPLSLQNPLEEKEASSWNYNGDSYPSEMSSFQNNSFHSIKELTESSESQSYERKPRSNHRRDSMASSHDTSMSSPSYGSFTTYEKIPIKHGVEEEIVTPVRRSSRLRKQVISQ
ncbi:hypothetical protein UlMin_030666 [Ulmus minor]